MGANLVANNVANPTTDIDPTLRCNGVSRTQRGEYPTPTLVPSHVRQQNMRVDMSLVAT